MRAPLLLAVLLAAGCDKILGIEDTTVGDAGSGLLTFGERPGSDHQGVTTDAYVGEVGPSANFGDAVSMGVDGGAGTAISTLVKFDLTFIPTTAEIAEATLRLVTTDTGMSPDTCEVHRVLEAWTELQVSWDERMTGTAWMTPGAGAPDSRDAASLATLQPASASTEYTVAIPAAVVQDWVSDPGSNHGLVLVNSTGTVDAWFNSRESLDASTRPQLDVTF